MDELDGLERIFSKFSDGPELLPSAFIEHSLVIVGKPLVVEQNVFLHLLQRKPKRRTQTGRTAHIDGLLVRFDDVFDDGKAQTGTANLTRAAFIDAVKPVKNVV